jgi:opacity protein-like surface antigen
MAPRGWPNVRALSTEVQRTRRARDVAPLIAPAPIVRPATVAWPRGLEWGGLRVVVVVGHENVQDRRTQEPGRRGGRMDRRERRGATVSRAWQRAGLGLAALALALSPSPGRAGEPWTEGRQLARPKSTAGGAGGSLASPGGVASPRPESVLIAQAGGTPPWDASPGGWRFTIAPYLWTPRTEIDLAVGDLERSATLDFSDVVEDLRFGFTTHFEATWREWTGLLDVFYFKLEKEETTGAGLPTEMDFQELFVEFGGTYRLATLPIGRTGRLTLEALGGGRLVYVDAELSIGARLRTRTATLIDPMVGGRVAYHVTDTVALWFRGDVAGFGISDSQSQLTYNLIAGLNWRFAHAASIFAGWRHLHVEIEKGSGLSTLDADVSMTGPVLGVNFYF